jgi:hypothetical protein
MEGTGLFAGSGNKSGKISRIKKARKWRDFSDETLRKGIDTGRYGYEQFKEATNPLKSEGKKVIKGLSKMFGGELEGDEDEFEGEGFFDDIKKGYNKKVKNSALGKALRESAGMAISDGYDRGAREIGKNKYGKPISQYMRNKRGSNVDKLTGYTGLGLRMAGDGKMKTAVYRRPGLDKLLTKHGKGLRMSGGMCQGCGMMNDKFIFADQAL